MASMTFAVDDDSTGNRIPLVQITITENPGGTLSFDVIQVTSPGAYLGDLRGIFFDIAREALIGSLFVTGVSGGPLTELRQEADGVRDLGNSANMQGLFGTGNTSSDPNNNQGYDVGIEIGTQGLANDVREFHFTLGSGLGSLSIADITNRDIGIRLTSVGRDTDGDGTIDTSRGYQARIVENTLQSIEATDDSIGTMAEDTVAFGTLLANDLGPGAKELTGVEYKGVAYGFSGTDPILIALTDTGGDAVGATVTIHRNGSYEVDALGADLLSQGQSIDFDIAYHARNTVLETNGSVAGIGTDTAHFVGAIAGANDAPVIGSGDFSGAVVKFVRPPEIDLSDLDGSNGFSVSGFESSEHARNMVAGGDVNGDGYADMIVGAGIADISGADSGAAYVVFGKPSGFGPDIGVSSLDGSNGFRLVGVAAGDSAGGSVAFLGDVNGDGFGDFAIGANGASTGGHWSGSTYIVFGKAGGFDPSIDLANLSGTEGFRIDGDTVNATGASIWVSSAGDINGDGLNEIIIGTPQGHGSPGAAYVVFGRDSGFSAAMSVASLDGTNGFKINGQGSQRAAWSVSSAGDFNDDGYGDIIVGANEAAAAWVIFGQDEGFSAQMNLADLNGADGFRLNGIAVPPGSTEFEGADIDGTGVSVSCAGDINGDSIDDVVIGAHGGPFGTWPGAAYVVFGTASPFAANFSLSSLDGDNGFKLVGNRGTGGSTSAAGDFNGDGYDDLIVGNPHAVSGASYVVFGKPGGFAATMDLLTLDGTDGITLPGLAAGDRSGTVSSADVNGDGLGDLLIAAKGNETNGPDTAYVVFGQSQGTLVLADSGTFDFADVDLADSHTVSVTPAGGGYRGSLTAVVADDSTGDGYGSISWSFAVEQAALADLTPGQSLTQTYSVAVNDGNGGIDQRDITITLSAELLFA